MSATRFLSQFTTYLMSQFGRLYPMQEYIAPQEAMKRMADEVLELRGLLAGESVDAETGCADDQSPLMASLFAMTPERRREFIQQFNTITPEQIATAMESMPTDVLEFGVRFEALGYTDSDRREERPYDAMGDSQGRP